MFLTLYGNVPTFNLLTLISLTSFIVIYPPCINALIQIAVEGGKKLLVISVLSLYAQAFIISALLRILVLKPIPTIIIVLLVIFTKVLYENVFSRQKRKVNKGTTPLL